MTLRFLIAPDSFKESMTAIQAATAIKKGVAAVFPDAVVDLVPMSDGGEGFLHVVMTNSRGELKTTMVKDVFFENEIMASIGLIDGGKTAIIEVASVIGLELLAPNKRNPLLATSYGVGQLIKFALDCGVKKIIIGLGGSSTNDGGVGMARALGYSFLNAEGEEIAAENMDELARIDETNVDERLQSVKIIGATDVKNVLLGSFGATEVFAEQKGANLEMKKQLGRNLTRLAVVYSQAFDKTPQKKQGSGASGGLGYGILAFCHGQLISGGDYLLKLTKFEKKVSECDVVMTGEGAIDGQTAFGKLIVKEAHLAKKHDKPLIAFVGKIGDGSARLYDEGVTAIFSILDRVEPLEIALKNGPENLERTARDVALLLQTGL